MSSTIEQTLRKSKEIEERYKLFLAGEADRKKSMQETFDKIAKTQQTLENTKKTLGSIDKLYSDYQESFSKVIDTALKGIEKSVLFNVAEPGYVPNVIDAKQIVKILKQKKKILILTGAGMSAGSGIPTFRGADGFWNKENKEEDMTTPQEILTNKYYQENEFKTWNWLQNFYQIKKKCSPNKGHFALSAIIEELKKRGREVCLVTQNIDNYHVQAHNQRKTKDKKCPEYEIFEIHGNITKIRCQNCTNNQKKLVFYPFQEHRKAIINRKAPYCSKCQNKLRPHIMFFDEFYSETIHHVDSVNKFLEDADLVLIIGTALQTGLSRIIVQKSLQKQRKIIDINVTCEIKRTNVGWAEGKAQEVLEKVKFQLWKTDF